MTNTGRNISIGIILVAGIFLAVLAIYQHSRKHPVQDQSKQGKVFVEAEPIQTTSGWGYNIIADHKIYIHQEFIPAIQGNKAFATRADALKTAGLVISKIGKGKLPYITKKEIDSLKIAY